MDYLIGLLVERSNRPRMMWRCRDGDVDILQLAILLDQQGADRLCKRPGVPALVSIEIGAHQIQTGQTFGHSRCRRRNDGGVEPARHADHD